jgi:protein-tyrosine phosphatase
MVCTGNICRSPMAEVILAQRLRQLGLDGEVSSAGLSAVVGAPADPLAQELMLKRGLDLTKHRGRQLSAEMVRGADLVLVMEERQQRAVQSVETSARGRVHRLGRMGKFDIPDPYRRGRASFEEALRLVDRGLDELVPVFWRTS